MSHCGHSIGSGVPGCLGKPVIQATAFRPLALDMKAREADNIRAITTAAVLNPSPGFIKPVLSQKLG